MDLEWNQNPYGKSNYYPDLPFEIIEIGAVRVVRTERYWILTNRL